MPAALTYPGVYVEEIPSGVRTITGVATSITAFLGRAPRGPVNDPMIINSFADFERQFGGLAIDYPMSYAVNDFYKNGGSQALIVRLYRPDAGTTGVAQIVVDGLKLNAASPGSWGNNLSATVDTNDITDEVAKQFGLVKEDLFNLIIAEKRGEQIVNQERLRNLSVKDDAKVSVAAGRARRIDRVLEQSSELVSIPLKADGTPDLPSKPPAPPAPPAPPVVPPAAAPLAPPAPAAPPPNPDGAPLQADDFKGKPAEKTGLYALEKADLFNLLCIPADTRGGDTPPDVYAAAMQYCKTRRAMLIVDSPAAWSANPDTAAATAKSKFSTPAAGDLSLNGQEARNAVLYFPRVLQADPLRQGQSDVFVPCGLVAGAMARTDVQRGVWKAPAGLDASLNGIAGVEVNLTNDENGMLNPLGINCLRTFPVFGRVLWGARTLRGADQLADEYKYIPVRRLALYIEESLYRGTQWVVFEPNDEPLWAQIRLNVGAFMHNLFRQGAFQGTTPRDAYFVKCDKETTTQNDINLGIVNIVVGFAPLKPAEFVVIKLQQMAGQIDT